VPGGSVSVLFTSVLDFGYWSYTTVVLLVTDPFEPVISDPESIELLDQLRARREGGEDVRLYYLSNMPVPYARALERRLPFFQWFDGGVFSGDVKLVKPNSEIYELLAWRHGFDPAQTLFIDDTAANVEAARALGWRAIHCTAPKALGAQVTRHLAPGDQPSV